MLCKFTYCYYPRRMRGCHYHQADKRNFFDIVCRALFWYSWVPYDSNTAVEGQRTPKTRLSSIMVGKSCRCVYLTLTDGACQVAGPSKSIPIVSKRLESCIGLAGIVQLNTRGSVIHSPESLLLIVLPMCSPRYRLFPRLLHLTALHSRVSTPTTGTHAR